MSTYKTHISIKHNKTCVTRVQEEEREKQEDLFEKIIAENLPTLGKETDIQIQKTQKTPPKSTKVGQHQDIL